MISLQQQFLEALTGPCGIRQGSALVIAVSGGPDSMALLDLLADVQQQMGLDLTAAWVDHGLRPDESKAEGENVATAAATLNIPFHARQVDATAFAFEQHLSLEHAARDLRYTALRQVAGAVQAEHIAVAHTADDQAEEILLRLLRGSGRKGMSGMSMCSRDLIRPFLQTKKAQLLDWLQEQKILYCVDSSNTDLKFLRNRVRHQLLPFLEEQFDSGVRKSLCKTAEVLAVEESLLPELSEAASAEVVRLAVVSQEGTKTTQLLRKSFNTLHPALQRRVVEQLLWQIGSLAGYDHILLILKAAAGGRNNSELHLSRGLRVAVFREYLEFSYPVGCIPWRGSLRPGNKKSSK